MRKLIFLGLGTVLFPALIGIQSASATPIVLTGDYLKAGISDYGTFGSDGNTSPGLIHDPSGKGVFDPNNDYVSPGDPHDSFEVNSTQTGFNVNDNHGTNSFGFTSPTLLTGSAANGYSNAATWTGSLAGFLTITNSYFFNPGDEQIKVVSKITALSDLTNLAFGRSVDPDPDSLSHGTADTINTRGDKLTKPEDLASSAGSVSGLTLGILNTTPASAGYAHNTGISTFCCNADDPYNVIKGYGPSYPTTNEGDYGLQLAWSIGSLTNGETAEIDYSYVVGTAQGTVSAPGGSGISPVPLPASAPLFGGALVVLAGFGYGLKRRRALREAAV